MRKTFLLSCFQLDNSLNLGLENEEYYSEILPIVFRAINENNEISEASKIEISEELVKEITYLNYRREKVKNTELSRYKYITNFSKFLLDGNYDKYLDNLFEIFGEHDYNKLYFDIVLSLLTYLYYVIEIEINAYVNEEKKKKYRYLYDKLIKLVNPNNRYIFFEDNDYTEKLFDKMKHVSRSWEIYKDGQVKTPLADESVIIANKSLLVYSRINDYTHGKSVGNYDLELFKYNFEKGTIKNDVYEAIKSYLSFIKLKVEEDRIKEYFESLLNIASKEYKFRNQASKEDFEKGKKSIPALKKDLIERLNNYTIFNNVDTDNEVEIPVRYSFDNSSIGYLVDSINFYNNEFIKVIIWNICHKIAMEITDRAKYSYDNNEPILQKLNKLRGPYYYICYEKDNLGEKWNLGEKYNIAKNRFKIATVPLYNGAMVVKDYACSLKDIEMEITELKDDEVLKYLERYKNDRMYVVNEFGYEVPYNKKEIIEYIKMNNFTISLKAKIKLKVVNNKGTVFVYVNKIK